MTPGDLLEEGPGYRVYQISNDAEGLCMAELIEDEPDYESLLNWEA